MTNKFTYTPSGVCCRSIDIELEDGKIKDVVFTGGCSGNLSGIKRLIVGESAESVIAKLEGIQCGMKGTSCPDQLAQALKTNK